MSDEVKVYKPETIKDTPFPQEEGEGLETSQKTGVVYTPQTINDKPFPIARISNELISSVLNTKTKKILGEFTFTPSGALKIGDYQEGEAGQINISPDGIVARNTDGETTFSLDGDTGDATFLGTVRAGSLISDSTIEGGAININDVFLVDADGNVTMLAGSLNINDKFIVDTNGNVTINTGQITLKDEDETTTIDSKGVVSTALSTFTGSSNASLNQTLTGTGYEDITGSALNFTLDRTAIVLIIVSITGWMTRGAGDSGTAQTFINTGSDITPATLWTDQEGYSSSNHYLVSLAGGSHTIKIRAKLAISGGSPSFTVHSYRLTYIVLGK